MIADVRRNNENPIESLMKSEQEVIQVLPPNSNSIERMTTMLPCDDNSWKTDTVYRIPTRPYKLDISKLEIDIDQFAQDLKSGQAIHLVQSESQYRHQEELQDMYGAIRMITTDLEYVLEDDIQKEMVRQYGIDIPLRIRCQWAPSTPTSTTNETEEEKSVFACGSGTCQKQRKVTSKAFAINQLYIPKKSVDDEYADHVMGQYRLGISKHIHDPEVRKKAFFLRNNIVIPGYQIGDIIDTDNVPLVPFAINGVEIMNNDASTSLAGIIDNAVSKGKERLIILSGSIT